MNKIIKNNIKKIISVILLCFFIFLTAINSVFATVSYTYNLGVDSFTISFNDDFQQTVFLSNQKKEIDNFFSLVTTSGYTKNVNNIVISGSKIENIFLVAKKNINPLYVNGKNLDYYVKKYNGDINNLNNTSFIENLVRQNMPLNNNSNYALILTLTNLLKTKYNLLIDVSSTFSVLQTEKSALDLFNIYKSQLGSRDDFNFLVANEMIKKMNLSRGDYLKSMNYSGNIAKITEDYNFISSFINGKYTNDIASSYNNLFIYNSLLNKGLDQTVLDSIKLKFFSYKKYDGSNVEFINPITGIMNDGDKFNSANKTALLSSTTSIKDEIVTSINALNTYEISKGNTYTGTTTGDIVNSIYESSSGSLNYTGSTTISDTVNGSSLLSNVLSISSLNDESLNSLYKTDLDKIKKKDIEFLQINKSFLTKEKTKLQFLLGSTASGANILNNVINSTDVITDADISTNIQSDLDISSVDDVIAKNTNISYDLNTDPSIDIFKKIYKKNKVLSINNPILSSNFTIPPISMSIVDSVSYKNGFLGINSNILSSYRANNTVTLIPSDPNKKGFKKIGFSYVPNPVIIKNSENIPGLQYSYGFEDDSGMIIKNNMVEISGKIGKGIKPNIGGSLKTTTPINLGKTYSINMRVDFTPANRPSNASGRWTLVAKDGGGRNHIVIKTSDGQLGFWSTPTFYSSGYDVRPLTGWHMLTMVSDGINTTYYIDGTKVGNTINNMIIDTGVNTIGRFGNPVNSGSQTSMPFDEISLYNDNINTSDIQKLYNGGTGIDAYDLNKSIGLKLGNKETYYTNKSIKIDLIKDNYNLTLYSINSGFKNLKIFFNGSRINVGGLMNIASSGNVKITYNENNGDRNFMPALWIKGLIK